MWANLSVWLLSLLSVGLMVHQYHLYVENKAQREEILHLRSIIVQLQEEKQHLRGENTWSKVVFCVTTAQGVVAGIAGGAKPTILYQAASSLLYYIFGIDLSTNIPKIADPSGV